MIPLNIRKSQKQSLLFSGSSIQTSDFLPEHISYVDSPDYNIRLSAALFEQNFFLFQSHSLYYPFAIYIKFVCGIPCVIIGIHISLVDFFHIHNCRSRLLHAVFLRLTNPAIHTFCTYKQYGSYDPEQTWDAYYNAIIIFYFSIIIYSIFLGTTSHQPLLLRLMEPAHSL